MVLVLPADTYTPQQSVPCLHWLLAPTSKEQFDPVLKAPGVVLSESHLKITPLEEAPFSILSMDDPDMIEGIHTFSLKELSELLYFPQQSVSFLHAFAPAVVSHLPPVWPRFDEISGFVLQVNPYGLTGPPSVL